MLSLLVTAAKLPKLRIEAREKVSGPAGTFQNSARQGETDHLRDDHQRQRHLILARLLCVDAQFLIYGAGDQAQPGSEGCCRAWRRL